MTNHNTQPAHHAKTARRPFALLGGSLVAVAAITLSAVAFAKQDEKPGVTMKVDATPLTRTAPSATESYAPIVKEVAPSVVKVLVTERAKNVPVADNPFFSDPRFRDFFGPFFGPYGDDDGSGGNRGNNRRGSRMQRQPEQTGLGSGVIVSADGYVLTNAHVVNGADEIKVSLNDGRELKAKVIGTDPKTDIAVIKVEATGLPAATFADSDQLEVGDRVLAIGNPFGIGQTVTAGMISALGRGVGIIEDGQGYEDFIQTDASINPGNSGGALTDMSGRVIGINTAILSRSGGFQGIGLAIPSNLVRSVMEQLVANGKVVRGFIGVAVQNLTPEMAGQFKLKNADGALVAEVTPDGPSSKIGIQPGDIITDFNGRAVKDGRTLRLAVAAVAPGTSASITVMRDGKPEQLAIVVGNQPGEKSTSGDNASGDTKTEDNGTLNGVGVADLDARTRRAYGISSNITGAVITDVDPDSPAAAAGLRPGDVIQEINREPVANADEAVKLTENPPSKKTLLRVWSRGGTRFVLVDETESPEASKK
ncbi:serine protease Do [Ereboglobus sp. PH5-5]|uniref:DegQ family serine endoprotease n=1 Tax=Ereboglobus sp. PH5-5 TaxID=2940529 RepID=UPI0024070805|nr:DegQ family serine endoprotease [Ereboglobus sp. PH5-5]MDF9833537.1 serine protease Do [Ereboglobus sp. PH5-5]